jgi:hypothetical protein
MGDNPRPTPGRPISKSQPTQPLAPSNLQQLEEVLRKAGHGGCVDVTSHFKMRAAQRGFTTPETLRILKYGAIIGEPEFCAEFCNWKFSVEGEHDSGRLVIVAAVSAGDRGQSWSRNVMLITGYVR